MSVGSKDGAARAGGKLAGGVDDNGNEHILNCDETGTLFVVDKTEGYGIVGTYADLPVITPDNQDSTFLVLNSTGIPFVNQKPAGFYKVVGGVWTFIGANQGAAGGNVTVTNFPAVQDVNVLTLPAFPPLVIAPSTTATVIAETISTTPVVLLGTNLSRKGFAVQATDSVVFVKLDTTVSTALYSYEVPRKGLLEIENYCGPVAAVTASGSTIAMVTEKV